MPAFLKKILPFLLIALLAIGAVVMLQQPAEQPAEHLAEDHRFFYYFYRVGCPFCDKIELFFENELKPDLPELEIRKIDVGRGEDKNIDFFINLSKNHFGITSATGLGAVPAVFIENYYLIGAPTPTEEYKIKRLVKRCIKEGCISPRNFTIEETQNIRLLPPGYFDLVDPVEQKELIIALPIFGNVNIEEVGFTVFTIMVAAMDGLNPCALWILLFLLTYAIKEKSRKKMILVAGTFILTSAIFYFFLLMGWLELFQLFKYVDPLKIAIGFLAIIVGVSQIYGALKKTKGCPLFLENSKRYKKINQKIKDIFAANSLKYIIPGTIFLALSVNLFEFFCSAGFPAIFTGIMALQGFPRYIELSFIALYVFVFMLDQIIIFTIAFITLKTITSTEKIAKWVGLIGRLLPI